MAFCTPLSSCVLVVLACLAARASSEPTNLTIATFLGNGSATAGGNGGPPSGATVHYPTGMAYDVCGSTFFFSDRSSSLVRSVTNFSVSIFAGNGTQSSSGDFGPALLATLNSPDGLAVAPDGAVFIAELYGNRLRLVTPNGIISTVAGNGTGSSSGDGGPASAATLHWPRRVAISPTGNIFISESGGCRIRRIDSLSGLIFSIVGDGSCIRSGDGGPAVFARTANVYGLAFDSKGILHFSEHGNACGVRKIDAQGIVTTVVGGNGSCLSAGDGGPATGGLLKTPLDVQFDSADNLFIVDYGDSALRFVSRLSGNISTVAGQRGLTAPLTDGGAATAATLWSPEGFIILPNKTALISDAGNNRIRSLSALPFGPSRYASARVCPTIATFLGNDVSLSAGNGGPPGSATASQPTGMAFDACNSTLFFSDRGGHAVRTVTFPPSAPNGVVNAFAGNGSSFSSGDFGPALSAALHGPDGLALGPDGTLYIVEFLGNRIRRVAPNGIISTIAGNGSQSSFGDYGPATAATFNSPRRVAVSPAGDLIISESSGCRIRRIDLTSGLIFTVVGDGNCSRSGDGGPAALARMASGHGLAFDSAGDLYFTERSNRCGIRKISSDGIVRTVVGASGVCATSGDGALAAQGAVNAPFELQIDSADKIYVIELNGPVLRLVSRIGGALSTIAGLRGETTFSGDGGAAAASTLSGPQGFIILPNMSALIGDTEHSRIRSLSALPFGPGRFASARVCFPPSSSPTPSSTVSKSATLTASIPPTARGSGSGSLTPTPTASIFASPSTLPSTSSASSKTATVSPAQTPSVAASPSATRPPSASPLSTTTDTSTSTQSSSLAGTTSATRSPSPAASTSASRAQSPSPAGTPAGTPSVAASVSASGTATPAASVSATATGASTPSTTPSTAGSPSHSTTPGASPSTSATQQSTPSTTRSPGASVAETASPSAEATRSASGSVSPTSTPISPIVFGTPSASSTPSTSAARTFSRSLSPASTPSSVEASRSAAAAASPPATLSVSPTSSSQQSLTQTPGGAPITPMSLSSSPLPSQRSFSSSASPSPSTSASPVIVPVGAWVFTEIGLDGRLTTTRGTCAPPASDRCIGAVNGSVVCGAGYEGFACASCASSFFADSQGYCRSCPPGAQAGSSTSAAAALTALLLPSLYLLGAVVGLTALNGALVCCATRFYGGTLAGGARRSLGFFIYLMSILSTIAQAAQTARVGLPPLLVSLYAYLAVLRADFASPAVGATPPGCLAPQSRFVVDLAFFGASVSLSLSLFALIVCAPACPCRLCRRACSWLPQHAAVDVALRLARGPGPMAVPRHASARDASAPALSSPPGGLGAGALLAAGKGKRVWSGVRSSLITVVDSGGKRMDSSLQPMRMATNPAAAAVAVRVSPAPVGGRRFAFAAFLRLLVKGLFVLTMLLYASASCRAVSSVVCTPLTMPVSAYLSLKNQDGETLQRVLPEIMLLLETTGTGAGPPASLAAAAAGPANLNSTALATTPIAVSVLLADPTVVCREGGHRIVWAMAILSLAIFSGLFPIASALWVAHRTRLVVLSSAVAWDFASVTSGARRVGLTVRVADAFLRMRTWAIFWACCCPRHGRFSLVASRWALSLPPPPTKKGPPLQQQQPQRSSSSSSRNAGDNVLSSSLAASAAVAAAPQAYSRAAANAIIDSHPLVVQDPGLSFFAASDYRASQSYFRQLDACGIFIVGAINAAIPVANSLVQAAVKFGAPSWPSQSSLR